MCAGQFYIEGDLPYRCPHCGTRLWLYGDYSKDSVFIRQGVSTRSKTLNKGVTSAKRRAGEETMAAVQTKAGRIQ